MNRKKLDNSQKRAAIHARMTESELKTLELMAGQERRNVSDMVRALIVEGTRNRAVLPTEYEGIML